MLDFLLNNIILILVGWYVVGYISCIISLILEGAIDVDDLVKSIVVALFGPLFTLILIHEYYKKSKIRNKVIWRKK